MLLLHGVRIQNHNEDYKDCERLDGSLFVGLVDVDDVVQVRADCFAFGTKVTKRPED